MPHVDIPPKIARPPLNFVTQQAIGSLSFEPPPLDGSLLFPEMLDWHLEHSWGHTFCILAGHNPETTAVVSWGEFVLAVHKLAGQFLSDIPFGSGEREDCPRTVSIIADIHSLAYVTAVAGLMRAGYEPFPISPRIGVHGSQHLLRSANVVAVVSSSDVDAMTGSIELTSSIEATVKDLLVDLPELHILRIPAISDLYPRLCKSSVEPYDHFSALGSAHLLAPLRSFTSYADANGSSAALIVHSSGTTGLPKPIRIRHAALLTWIASPWFADFDRCGTIWATMSMPPFYMMGLQDILFSAAGVGSIPALFNISKVPVRPTATNILAAMRSARVGYANLPPSLYQDWSVDLASMAILATLKRVYYGGGPLPRSTAERLIGAGVKIQSVYGSTEAGPIAFVGRPSTTITQDNWQYFKFKPHLQLSLAQLDDSIFRVIIHESPEHRLGAYSTPQSGTWDTNDAIEEHPTDKGLWRVVGRADQLIVMSNGLKVNPSDAESAIGGNPLIRDVIVFGRGRTQVGLLVDAADPSHVRTREGQRDLLTAIWADIVKANAIIPAHARIFRELILFSDPVSKPFIRTAKGTVNRQATLTLYESEISACYQSVEEGGPPLEDVPKELNSGTILAYVRRVTKAIMRDESGSSEELQNDRDLFEQGCDSLLALRIRRLLVRFCRSVPEQSADGSDRTSSLPQDVVYLYPSVSLLASYLSTLLFGPDNDLALQSSAPEAGSRMLKLVEQYSNGFLLNRAGRSPVLDEHEEVMVITGTTGSLGSFLLRNALLDPNVRAVYALNRTSARQTLRRRQTDAFAEREISLHLLDSQKLRLVEADLTAPDLGIDTDLLHEITAVVTMVIHNAWRVNFNLTLSSFEPELKIMRNLIDLCLATKQADPSHFILISSIASCANWSGTGPVPEQAMTDPNSAAQTGYGQSKWVAEMLLLRAGQEAGLRSTVWRLGQLTGSTINGAWKTSDWVPMMVKTAQTTKCLPSLDTFVEWLPVDAAATVVTNALHGSQVDVRYLHLVHPRPVPWNAVYGRFAERLAVPLRPYRLWLAELEAQNHLELLTDHSNPALKILPFLRSMRDHPDQDHHGPENERVSNVMHSRLFSTENACRESGQLSVLHTLSQDEVDKWMHHWEKQQFLIVRSRDEKK